MNSPSSGRLRPLCFAKGRVNAGRSRTIVRILHEYVEVRTRDSVGGARGKDHDTKKIIVNRMIARHVIAVSQSLDPSARRLAHSNKTHSNGVRQRIGSLDIGLAREEQNCNPLTCSDRREGPENHEWRRLGSLLKTVKVFPKLSSLYAPLCASSSAIGAAAT